jgi:hypothetical protein
MMDVEGISNMDSSAGMTKITQMSQKNWYGSLESSRPQDTSSSRFARIQCILGEQVNNEMRSNN